LVNVTWPHEEDREKADPSESNRESTHFTLDSRYSQDLTNKQLNLTIELTADERGPKATAGGYVISLVSVAAFDRVVVVGSGGSGAGGAGVDAGGSGGAPGDASIVDAPLDGKSDAGKDSGGPGRDGDGMVGSTGGAGSGAGGVGGSSSTGSGTGGVDGLEGTGGVMTTTERGYSETESPVEDRATLRHVGDRATITLALPNKTEAEDSYNPTRVIKINVRIYNVFSSDASGTGGVTGAGGTSAETGTSGTSGATSAPVYDYLTSQFTITKFSITDVVVPLSIAPKASAIGRSRDRRPPCAQTWPIEVVPVNTPGQTTTSEPTPQQKIVAVRRKRRSSGVRRRVPLHCVLRVGKSFCVSQLHTYPFAG
jgi:hypothetical protein